MERWCDLHHLIADMLDHVGQRRIALLVLTLALALVVTSACGPNRESGSRAASRWRPGKEECVPSPPTRRPRRGHWLVYFDGFAASSRRSIRHLGVSTPVGVSASAAKVIVMTPKGSTFTAIERPLFPNHVRFLRWPTDFRGAPRKQQRGIYTVVWQVATEPVTTLCAGFVVR
jgi:hypothetical protein